jgi:hypothetical protein
MNQVPSLLTDATRSTLDACVFKTECNTVFKQQMIKAKVSEGKFPYPKNYTRQGNRFTYGRSFNCLGFLYQPLYCFYQNDRVDEIYDIRTWMHYKGYIQQMLAEGYVFFNDFHAQVNKTFNHPNHLVNLFMRFHEDYEFYNELMWLRELNENDIQE